MDEHRKNVDYESDVTEETMICMVKLAKEIDGPDKLRVEGESVDANEKKADGNRGPVEVFDGGKDTDKYFKIPHTEKCEKNEVTSMEEERDVDEFERDELHTALRSTLETQVFVCAHE